MKILIVEDDDICRLLLISTLQSMGHDVIATADGADACKVLDSKDVEVVLSDLHLPRMDGLQLCQHVRRLKRDYIYFILTTNSGTDNRADAPATAAGVDDFVGKPAHVLELSRRLRTAEHHLKLHRQISLLETQLAAVESRPGQSDR